MDTAILFRKGLMIRVFVGCVFSSLFFLAGTGNVNGGIWTSTGDMAAARRDHTATLLKNGKVLIVGWITVQAELYNPDIGTFSTAGETLFNHGQGSTATLLHDGRVLIVGGASSDTYAEIYDPATGIFSQTGSLNQPHAYHTATLLPDGKVLIAAGLDSTNAGAQSQATAELYDPSIGTFSLTGSLNIDRMAHEAAMLSNGNVLIVGGIQTTTPGYGIALNSAELYDPTTGEFTLTSIMNMARAGHTATLLRNGQVLVAGGILGNTSVELYNSDTGTFSLTGNMSTPRGSHTATLLQNGQVLIAGGYVAVGPVTTSSAELYDPVSGGFTTTDNMTTARQQHSATILDDGRVLVTGGSNDSNNTNSAELFSRISCLGIIKFFDTSVENGTLHGTGHGQLNAYRNMLEAAENMLEHGTTTGACKHLMEVYKKSDGNPVPPDFVEGDGRTELARMIQDLRTSLGCQQTWPTPAIY